jgi:hypothetical protein
MAISLPLAQTPIQNYQLTSSLAYNISARTTYKTQFFHCCIIKNLLPSKGNVFTKPFPSNGRCLHSPFSNGSMRHNTSLIHFTVMAHIPANLIKWFQTIAGKVILFLSTRGARAMKMASTQGK